MGRTQYEWNETKYKRFLKEGRGTGRGKDYRPWLTINDVSSQGRRSRPKGWKTERVHHLMSDHEDRYFCLLEWADSVIDIQEQYPLDIKVTQEIARRIGVKHPVGNEDFPIVLTTDFRIFMRKGQKEVEIARTIKESRELEKTRTLEKLEIERIYWDMKDVDWGIVTERDIPRPLARNIQSLHEDYWLDTVEDSDTARLLALADLLKDRLRSIRGTFISVTKNFDTEMNLNTGTSIKLLRYLIARKQVSVDLSENLDFSKSIENINYIETAPIRRLKLA